MECVAVSAAEGEEVTPMEERSVHCSRRNSYAVLSDLRSNDVSLSWNSDEEENFLQEGMQMPMEELTEYAKFFPELSKDYKNVATRNSFLDTLAEQGKGETTYLSLCHTY